MAEAKALMRTRPTLYEVVVCGVDSNLLPEPGYGSGLSEIIVTQIWQDGGSIAMRGKRTALRP